MDFFIFKFPMCIIYYFLFQAIFLLQVSPSQEEPSAVKKFIWKLLFIPKHTLNPFSKMFLKLPPNLPSEIFEHMGICDHSPQAIATAITFGQNKHLLGAVGQPHVDPVVMPPGFDPTLVGK